MFEDSQRVDPDTMFTALAAAIDALPTVAARGGTAAQSGARVRALLVLRRRLDARLAAEVAAFDEQGFASVHGSVSTASFLRAYGKLDSAQASRMVRVARLMPVLPLLTEVFTAGAIGAEHLEAVAAGSSRLPDDVLAIGDSTLRDFADIARPSELRRVAVRFQACHDETAVRDNADHVHDSRTVSLSRTFGDAWHLEGLLEPIAGAQLAVALDALMQRRGPEDDRSPGARRADALTELVELGLASGELPDRGGDRPRLTLLAPADPGTVAPVGVALFDQGDTRLLGHDAVLRPETIARIACDADVNAALLNGAGEPLAFGRSRRDPSPTQRRALSLRDGGCVFPGCDKPPAHCHAHHLEPWTPLGPTDQNNLALICSYHHHLVHEGRWTLVVIPVVPGTSPMGGWLAIAPDGHELRELRRPAA